MKIKWKTIQPKDYVVLEKWLSKQDKINLCMQNKSWEQTAKDIGECLQYMDNAQFKNLVGYINDTPVVFVMFGIEQIKVLNLYNIVVNPDWRNLGVAKNVIMQFVKNDSSLEISESYTKVVASAIQQNTAVHSLFESLGFANLGFDGEYVRLEKNIENVNEITLW